MRFGDKVVIIKNLDNIDNIDLHMGDTGLIVSEVFKDNTVYLEMDKKFKGSIEHSPCAKEGRGIRIDIKYLSYLKPLNFSVAQLKLFNKLKNNNYLILDKEEVYLIENNNRIKIFKPTFFSLIKMGIIKHFKTDNNLKYFKLYNLKNNNNFINRGIFYFNDLTEGFKNSVREYLYENDENDFINKFVYSIEEISIEEAKKRCMSFEFDAGDFKSFDDYHKWYLDGDDVPNHKTNSYALIEYEEDYEEWLIDGWHRFHSYVRSGFKSVYVMNIYRRINNELR